MVDLGREVQRMPDATEKMSIAGVMVPVVALASQEASAPVKAELALARIGLKPA
jgi:hypothetical protein